MPKILERPREGILEAAEQELTNKGVVGFNIRDVAALSGVAIGTIYNYYGNKFSLINSVLSSLWAKGLAKAVSVIKPGDPVGAVLALYDAVNHFEETERESIDAIRAAGNFFGDEAYENELLRRELANAIAPSLGDNVFRPAELILAELVLFAAIERKISVEDLKKATTKIVA